MCAPDKPIDKEILIEWVARFLNYWEDESMLYWPAAEIIVNQIMESGKLLKAGEQMGIDRLPEIQDYFPD